MMSDGIHRQYKEQSLGRFLKKKKLMRLEPGFPVLGQAVPAVDRPSFRWLEGDFAFFAAV